jgi:hypothetical protein
MEVKANGSTTAMDEGLRIREDRITGILDLDRDAVRASGVAPGGGPGEQTAGRADICSGRSRYQAEGQGVRREITIPGGEQQGMRRFGMDRGIRNHAQHRLRIDLVDEDLERIRCAQDRVAVIGNDGGDRIGSRALVFCRRPGDFPASQD